MRVALYARVSTDRQEKQRTIGSQLEALEAKAAAEGWVVELRCNDDGYTGTRLDRPGLDRVRDAAAASLIDAVVVLCPDRLSRNYLHQALVLDELARFGVSVFFVEGGLADDPHGRLVAQIQAAVAEFERTKVLERNRRGKLWRARQGAVVAASAAYGYRKLPAADGLPARLEIREDQAGVVRDIFDWHADEGLSIRSIAIRLIEAGVPSPRGHQLWSTSTLDRLVRNEVYAGTLYYNRHVLLPAPERLARHAPGHRPIKQRRPEEEWIAVSVPAIVDADTWPGPRPATVATASSAPDMWARSGSCCATSCAAVSASGPVAPPPEGPAPISSATTTAPRRCRCTFEKSGCAARNPRLEPTSSTSWSGTRSPATCSTPISSSRLVPPPGPTSPHRQLASSPICARNTAGSSTPTRPARSPLPTSKPAGTPSRTE